MTPHAFIAKWRASELKERSASQEHFLDLCRLLDEPTPAEADPSGATYCFERGARKDTGGDGWADVWKRHHFAWEYKGRRADLDAAFDQLRQYSLALENPPLLIVSDMVRFRIRTNWTNSVSQTHEFALEDLADAATRDRLKWAFADPERLRPGETRQSLTERAAAAFAAVAQALRERGHEPQAVAHFVNRLVFCMFADDVGLLPGHMFTRMLRHAHPAPERFPELAGELFQVMASGGRVGFETVAWFNGGLFDDGAALPLERSDIEKVLAASDLDWSEIDPSILGTLFERGLDPGKRAQLGAHYTDREKILQLVEPVVVRPLLAEWEREKAAVAAELERAEAARSRAARMKRRNDAERRYRAFLTRLREFTVLDPACGSGNFLYLALQALKDLEHRVQIEAEAALGIQRAFPEVGPANVKGIELNPYAAELARVSVWVGEIQWMRRNGFAEARNPVLKPLDTIECRDAILTPDDCEPEWPVADVVIGNPPFLGGKLLITHLGEDYVARMFATYAGRVPAEADLVCYWFEKAGRQIASGKAARAGLVATNSIRGGANRRALEAATETRRIFEAWSDEPWVIDGAAVRVSLVCFSRADDALVAGTRLDGQPVDEIYTDLTARRGAAGIDLTGARRLPENAGVAFMGDTKGGPFDVLGRPGARVAASAVEPERPAERRCPEAVGERHGPDAAAGGEVDRRLRVDDAGERRGAVRGTLPVGERTGPPDAPAEPARSRPSRVTGGGTLRAAPMWRALNGLSRYMATPRRQAPAVRLVRRTDLPGPPADRRRARRRRDLRHPAQPVPRALVAPALHVAREGQRPTLHAEHDLRDVPVPGRPDAERAGRQLRGRPTGDRRRRGRPAARRAARPVAQPARMGRLGGRAGSRIPAASRAPRRGRRQGAPEAHADEPLQRPPAVARRRARGARCRRRGRLRLASRRHRRRRPPRVAGAQRGIMTVAAWNRLDRPSGPGSGVAAGPRPS